MSKSSSRANTRRERSQSIGAVSRSGKASPQAMALIDKSNVSSRESIKDITTRKTKIPRKDLEQEILVLRKDLSARTRELEETKSKLYDAEHSKYAYLEKENERLDLKLLETLPQRIKEMLEGCFHHMPTSVRTNVKIEHLQIGDGNTVRSLSDEAEDVILQIRDWLQIFRRLLNASEQAAEERALLMLKSIENEVHMKKMSVTLKELQVTRSKQLSERDRNIIDIVTSDKPDNHVIVNGVEQYKQWLSARKSKKDFPWAAEAAVMRLVNKFESLNCHCKELMEILHISVSALKLDVNSKLDDEACKTILQYWIQHNETVEVNTFLNSLDELSSKFTNQLKEKYIEKTTSAVQDPQTMTTAGASDKDEVDTETAIANKILAEEITDRLKQLEESLATQLRQHNRNIVRVLTSERRFDSRVIVEGIEELKDWLRTHDVSQDDLPWMTEAAITRLVKKFENHSRKLAEILHIDLSALRIDQDSKLDESACKTLMVHWIQQTEPVSMDGLITNIEEFETKLEKTNSRSDACLETILQCTNETLRIVTNMDEKIDTNQSKAVVSVATAKSVQPASGIEDRDPLQAINDEIGTHL